MKTIIELRQERAAIIAKMRALNDKAGTENRDLTAEEKAEYERMAGEASTIKERYERMERQEQLDAEVDTLPSPRVDPLRGRQQPTEDRSNYNAWPVEEADQFFMMVRARAQFGNVPETIELPQSRAQFRFNAELRQTFIQLRAPSGMGTIVDQDGGFLVPMTIQATILQKMHEEGQVLARCQPVPITVGNTAAWNAVLENSRAAGSRYGGIEVNRTGEAAPATGTKPKVDRVLLMLKKQTALVYLTDEQIEDGPQAMTLVNVLVPKALTFATEDEIVNGNGAHQFLGILNAGCLVTVNKETGQAARTINYFNVINMLSRLSAGSMGSAAWFINQDTIPQLAQMALPVGTGGIPVWIPANGAAGPLLGTLFGRPVISIEHCATVGTVGDIVLADFSQYLLASKGSVQVAQSMHVKFIEGEQALRFTQRNDGKPWWPAALTPAKGSATQSPFVALATRA